MTNHSIVREIRVIRNLILGALTLGGLVGLRQLNTVPFRLQTEDEDNRIETVADLFGSYYRPIKDGEDVGQGVRYHNFKDAELAKDRHQSSLEIAAQAVEQARMVALAKARLIKRWLLRSSNVPEGYLYTDEQLDSLTDTDLRRLMNEQERMEKMGEETAAANVRFNKKILEEQKKLQESKLR